MPNPSKRRIKFDSKITNEDTLKITYEKIRYLDNLDYPRALIEKGNKIFEFSNPKISQNKILASVIITKKKSSEKKEILKKLNLKNKFEFEDLNCKKHIKILYDMFIKRKKEFRISSGKKINYTEHQKFVKNHPYRFWFLIKIKDNYKASLYLKFDNTLSLNMVSFDSKLYKEIILKAKDAILPLPEIPSVRPGRLIINISSQNLICDKLLKEIGLKNIQKTYVT